MAINSKAIAAVTLMLAFLIVYPATFYFNSEMQSVLRELQKQCVQSAQICIEENVKQLEDASVHIADMEEALSFLDPDIGSNCAEIFATNATREVIRDVLDKLEDYEERVEREKQKIREITRRRPTKEGYCSQDHENTFVMVKLARYVAYSSAT